MAETREPFTSHDRDYEMPNGSQRDGETRPEQAAERAAEYVTPATEGVPRGPNTPESLEQMLDLSDVPTEPGIHMHPASLTLPDEEFDISEGEDDEPIP